MEPAGHTVRRDAEPARTSTVNDRTNGGRTGHTRPWQDWAPTGRGGHPVPEPLRNVARPEGRSCDEGRRNSARLSWKTELERDMTAFLKY